jgi:hypothetical protein
MYKSILENFKEQPNQIEHLEFELRKLARFLTDYDHKEGGSCAQAVYRSQRFNDLIKEMDRVDSIF